MKAFLFLFQNIFRNKIIKVSFIFIFFSFAVWFIKYCNFQPSYVFHRRNKGFSLNFTFISVPKPIRSYQEYVRNKIAISSWLVSSPFVNVILFINQSDYGEQFNLPQEISKIFGNHRVLYSPTILTNEENVPYINDWFSRGVNISTTDFVLFINSDIIIGPHWIERAEQVITLLGFKNISIFAPRIEFDLPENFSFTNLNLGSKSFLEEISKYVLNSNYSFYTPNGIDLFLFNKKKVKFNIHSIPPFLMGWPRWDNWIIYHFIQSSETVSFFYFPSCFHMRHLANSRLATHKFFIHNENLSNYTFSFGNLQTQWILEETFLQNRITKQSYLLN